MDHLVIIRFITKEISFSKKIVKMEHNLKNLKQNESYISSPADNTLLSPQVATVEFLEFPNLLKK